MSGAETSLGRFAEESVDHLLRLRLAQHLRPQNLSDGLRIRCQAGHDATVHVVTPLSRRLAPGKGSVDFRGVQPKSDLLPWIALLRNPSSHSSNESGFRCSFPLLNRFRCSAERLLDGDVRNHVRHDLLLAVEES